MSFTNIEQYIFLHVNNEDQQLEQKDNEEEEEDLTRICLQDEDGRIYTYKDMCYIILQHKKWLSMLQQQQQQHDNDDSEIIVAYISTNCIDLLLGVLACFTCCSNNIIPAMVNTRWTKQEMVAALQPAQQKLLLIYGLGFKNIAYQVANTLEKSSTQSTKGIIINVQPLQMFSQQHNNISNFNLSLRQLRNDNNNDDTRKQQDDTALIVFTSGTSNGKPKGVLLSYEALYIQAHAKCLEPCNYNKTTNLLCTMPLYHIGGFSSVIAVLLISHGIVTLHTKFDPHIVWNTLTEKTQKTVPTNTLVVVPAMIHELQQQQLQNEKGETNNKYYDHVQLILIGGQSASNKQLQYLQYTFPNAKIVQTYACTEAASSITFLDVKTKIKTETNNDNNDGDCVGYPPSHIEIGIFNDNNKQQLPYNQKGIIATRGKHTMKGYWGSNNNNNIAQQKEKWMYTNDIGYINKNDGCLYYCGRITDSIRTGGETVMSLEVERILIQHPYIIDCAVFGIPNIQYGEIVCAAIVIVIDDTKAYEQQQQQQIRNFCKNQLAGYKVPKRIYYVKELPRNSSGKVLKHILKQKYGINQQKAKL